MRRLHLLTLEGEMKTDKDWIIRTHMRLVALFIVLFQRAEGSSIIMAQTQTVKGTGRF